MKKHLLALALLLAFGLVFFGCGGDDGEGGSGSGGSSSVTREYPGTDAQHRNVVVRIIRTSQAERSFEPATNDFYTIGMEGRLVSNGRIAVDGTAIYFYPAGSNSYFPGTVNGPVLEIPRIPLEDGYAILDVSPRSRGETGIGPGWGDLPDWWQRLPPDGSLPPNWWLQTP
ncbi:MAG: hypothetical protein FWH19_03645 [Treponema sp.]|nr:hypothetical protein [Treponema sp.]